MSIQGPPLYGDVLKDKIISQSWGQWFLGLFNSLGGINGVGDTYLTARIDNIHSTTPVYINIPKAGSLIAVSSCLQGTITGSNETLTITNVASSATIGTITVPSGSTAGTVNTLLNPTTAIAVTANTTIKVASAGASTGTPATIITLVMRYIP